LRPEEHHILNRGALTVQVGVEKEPLLESDKAVQARPQCLILDNSSEDPLIPLHFALAMPL